MAGTTEADIIADKKGIIKKSSLNKKATDFVTLSVAHLLFSALKNFRLYTDKPHTFHFLSACRY